MAGGGGGGDEENPVPVNCVALIDIIFCLCIFFMCSFHFRQLEGKLESWLPNKVGVQPVPIANPQLDEIRVFFSREPGGGTKLAFGSRVLGVLPPAVAESPERTRIF